MKKLDLHTTSLPHSGEYSSLLRRRNFIYQHISLYPPWSPCTIFHGPCHNFISLQDLNLVRMFSGIVEEAAPVVKIEKEKDNIHITMRCSFAHELKIDQSISHNGVCLTVVRKEGDTYTVTAIRETLDKTNLGLLKPGDKVNLERSTRLDGRLDGHMVQGHVDLTATCISVREAEGSWYYTFEYEPKSPGTSHG